MHRRGCGHVSVDAVAQWLANTCMYVLTYMRVHRLSQWLSRLECTYMHVSNFPILICIFPHSSATHVSRMPLPLNINHHYDPCPTPHSRDNQAAIMVICHRLPRDIPLAREIPLAWCRDLCRNGDLRAESSHTYVRYRVCICHLSCVFQHFNTSLSPSLLEGDGNSR